MEKLGIESAVLLYNKASGEAYKMGTAKGVAYLSANKSIGIDYMSFVGGEWSSRLHYAVTVLCVVLI